MSRSVVSSCLNRSDNYDITSDLFVGTGDFLCQQKRLSRAIDATNEDMQTQTACNKETGEDISPKVEQGYLGLREWWRNNTNMAASISVSTCHLVQVSSCLYAYMLHLQFLSC